MIYFFVFLLFFVGVFILEDAKVGLSEVKKKKNNNKIK
jgi:hypothetical protein